MGGDNMQVKRTASGIHDVYRGVFLNRGVFVKAPPGFFSAYPSDFEQPPQGWEKLNVQLRTIPNWDPKTGILAPPAPVNEVPSPAPTPVSTPTPTVVAAASEPVAASDNAQQTTPAAKPKTTARGRGVRIK